VLKTAWVLARKDLKLYLRDRTALLLNLAMPVCLATIFGAAMGAMSGGGKHMSRVEILDHGAESSALVTALETSDALRIERDENSRKHVSEGKAPAALVIPSGYGEDLRAGRKPGLKLFRDPSQVIEQQIIAASLVPGLVQAGGKDFARGMMRRGLESIGFSAESAPAVEAIFDQTWDDMHALAVSSRSASRSNALAGGDALASPASGHSTANEEKAFDFATDLPRLCGIDAEDVAGGEDKSQKTAGQAHAVAGIAVMMLLFGLTACGGTLLEEQASGTLQRLQLAPAAGASILAGKVLFTAIVGAMQLAVLFLYGSLIFSVPVFRDPIAVAATSAAVVCAATGLGLLLAVTCRTRKQLDGLATLIILVMSAVGGSWFPLVVTPEWYQRLGHLTLNAWAMDAYQGIFWYGKGLGGIWVDLVVLMGIGAATSYLALRGWSRRFESGR
jgi:ABC-2 type transport system permease protein